MAGPAHAPFPPSSAEQWGRCSGWLIATTGKPNIETPENREGTAAHWVGAEVLERFKAPDGGAPSAREYIGRAAPNGVVIDEKMAEGAQVLIDDVLEVCQRYGMLQHLLIEYRVSMPQIHPENWGTLDVSLYVPAPVGLLFVWDYKHGHREVSARGNLQLIDYTAGLLNAYEIDGFTEQRVEVVHRIVQPFCYRPRGPVDEWTGPLTDLRGTYNQLATKAAEARICPTLTPGLHCRDCSAVGPCSAARSAVYGFIDYADRPYAMDTMTGRDLATEREILRDGLRVAQARLEAVEDDLTERLMAGEAGTGLVLESSPGRLEFTCDPKTAAIFAQQFGVDINKPAVLTPSQSISKAPLAIRPVFKDALKAITRRPAGGLKLTKSEESLGARAFSKKGNHNATI